MRRHIYLLLSGLLIIPAYILHNLPSVPAANVPLHGNSIGEFYSKAEILQKRQNLFNMHYARIMPRLEGNAAGLCQAFLVALRLYFACPLLRTVV